MATLAFAVVPACFAPGLTPAGQNVVFLKVRTPQNCQDMGYLEGRANGSALYGDTMSEAATTDLRNRAGELGVTHLVFDDIYPTAHACRATARAYSCPHVPDLK